MSNKKFNNLTELHEAIGNVRYQGIEGFYAEISIDDYYERQ